MEEGKTLTKIEKAEMVKDVYLNHNKEYFQQFFSNWENMDDEEKNYGLCTDTEDSACVTIYNATCKIQLGTYEKGQTLTQVVFSGSADWNDNSDEEDDEDDEKVISLESEESSTKQYGEEFDLDGSQYFKVKPNQFTVRFQNLETIRKKLNLKKFDFPEDLFELDEEW